MNLNKSFILGRVTADLQLKKTPSGQSVTSFGVATNRTWTDKDGTKHEDVEFHNVVAWGRQAEIASQFLQKGSLVLVEGRLATRVWTDKNGTEHRATEIIAENIQLGPKPQGKAEEAPAPTAAPKKNPVPEEPRIVPTLDDDEILGREMTPLFPRDGESKPEEVPF